MKEIHVRVALSNKQEPQPDKGAKTFGMSSGLVSGLSIADNLQESDKEFVQWTVRIADDGRCQIVDDQGRERGIFQNYESTAIHLAIQLAQNHLDNFDNLDQMLKMRVEEFVDNQHDEI